MTENNGFYNIQDAFRQAMRDEGINYDGELIADGAWHRAKAEGDRNPDLAYILHADGVQNGVFEHHKLGVKGKWIAKPEKELTTEERSAYAKQMQATKAQRQADQDRRYRESSAKAKQVMDAASPATDNFPYLTAKQVPAYAGVKIGAWPQRQADGCLLIPFAGIDGNLTTIEAIASSGKLIGNSGKDWLIGGRKSGSFFVIGDIEAADVIVICEGYATCATVHQATGFCVVMAGDANNLKPVALAIHGKWPKKRLLIGADDDRNTEGNPGLKQAEIASCAVAGAFVKPVFDGDEIAAWRSSHNDKVPTDFNDLAVIRGLGAVKSVFDSALAASPEVDNVRNDELLVAYNQKGEPSLIAHNKAATILFKEVFNSLLFYDPIVLEWYQYQDTGVFKIRPDLSIQQALYRAIGCHSGDLGFSAGYVSSVAKCLLFESIHEPETPIGKVCFTNGVLQLKNRELLPHSPKHFFTTRLPFAWQPNAVDPQVVIDWMRETVDGNDDQIQLLRAFIHAVIVGRPDLQRFLEVIGPGGSGKSTLIRLLVSMLGSEAVHSTQLKHLEENRFETAKIFGKKLVVITDAEKWFGDISTLKAITGQDPIRFEEKNKQSGDSFIYGGMVLIAANQVTGSSDYSSAIQRRRITVEFNHVVPASKKRDLDAEFNPLLPSVVRWALDMPEHDVTDYLRSTGVRVSSLKSVRIEVLRQTNPIAAWLLDCVIFDESALTQVGLKEKVSITSGDHSSDKETRTEYRHQKTRLYPSYLAWSDRSGKQPINLQSFAKTVIDVCRNMLGKPYVEKVRQGGTGAAVIKGLLLRNCEVVCEVVCEDQVIDCEGCEVCEESKKSEDFSEPQKPESENSGDFSVNLEVYAGIPHRPHILNNQDVKPHTIPHNFQNVREVPAGADSPSPEAVTVKKAVVCDWNPNSGVRGAWGIKCAKPDFADREDGAVYCRSCGGVNR